MPELPEVETVRRDLQALIGKKIQEILVLRKEYIREGQDRIQTLRGSCFEKISRHGKLLIVSVGKKRLLFHLGMTGRLILDQDKPPHTHVIFLFEDGTSLRMQDVRRFGYIKLITCAQMNDILAHRGQDALDPIHSEALHTLFQKHHTTLKSFLLNQNHIAGLGNIYVDEICFASRIKPTRLTNTITSKEAEKLLLCMNTILQHAIRERGTSFRDYVDSRGEKGSFISKLAVYGRTKQLCRWCETPLITMQVSQRTTVFCPSCQK